MSAKHNSGAVADDTIIQWAREFFNRHGALPGRCVIEKQFGIKQQESRALSRQIKAALLVPAGPAATRSTATTPCVTGSTTAPRRVRAPS